MSRYDLRNDVYWAKDYIELYKKKGESFFNFDYIEGDSYFFSAGLKKPINIIAGKYVSDGFFDLETAYGYGGYLTNATNELFIQRAFFEYQSYCKAQKIVSEFIKFHPFNTFPLMFAPNLDYIVKLKKTVAICLECNKESRWSNYSRSTRTKIRRNIKLLEFNKTNNIEKFAEMYTQTMNENKAEEFYYFDKDYFYSLSKSNGFNLFEVSLDGITINMCIILTSNRFAHYHLAARDFNFTTVNGSFYLMEMICEYLQDNNSNLSYLHLGGGRTIFEDDKLLAFKSRFSNLTYDFYIGGKIFIPTVYNQYSLLRSRLSPKKLESKFQPYRRD